MKKLILLTNYFPYGNDTGEMYLRNEIFDLANSFDEIIVIACDASCNDVLFCNNLPNDVHVYPLEKSNRNKRLKYVLPFLKKLISKKSIIYDEELPYANNIMKKMFLLYFLAKCDSRIKKINEQEILKFNKDDIIYIYSYRLFDLAFVGVDIAKKINKNVSKVVSRTHGYDLYEENNRIKYLPMRSYLLSNLDFIYPCSLYGKNYLINHYKKYKSKVKVSYLGTLDYGISKYSKKNDTLELISCSNVIPVKRVELICEVVRNVSKTIKIHWTHLGGGKLLSQIVEKNSDLIDQKIISFVGACSHDDVIKFYKKNNYDLFINLSISEGIPQAIMEAISFGIPSIATNVGGNSEIVNDLSGFLVSANPSVEEVSKIIVDYYYMNINEKEKLRKKTRAFWHSTFNSKKNAIEFIKIIKEGD